MMKFLTPSPLSLPGFFHIVQNAQFLPEAPPGHVFRDSFVRLPVGPLDTTWLFSAPDRPWIMRLYLDLWSCIVCFSLLQTRMDYDPFRCVFLSPPSTLETFLRFQSLATSRGRNDDDFGPPPKLSRISLTNLHTRAGE